MDISVKSTFDKLTKACERVDSFRQKQKNELPLKWLLAEDIYDFINLISTSGAEERYSYFNEVYQGGAYPLSELDRADASGFPRVFAVLKEFDSSVQDKSKLQAAGLFVSFVSELQIPG